MTPLLALALAALALAAVALVGLYLVRDAARADAARLQRRIHKVERDLAWHLAGRKSPPPPHDWP